ncbi:MAG: hypothetical protein H5T69_07585 [Chloroflexi bacterium]|nr:hypothetical protein [Chloroflexota bacterium]
MKRLRQMVLILALGGLLVACAARSPKSIPSPTPQPTATPPPVATATPTETPLPTVTPYPTPYEVAPEETFTDVGNTAELSGSHGVGGKAIVAGLQTLIIQGFSYDGKGSQVDIRLVKGDDYDHPAHVFIELEERPYQAEFFLFRIPSSVGRGSADRIVVYSRASGEAYAVGVFD